MKASLVLAVAVAALPTSAWSWSENFNGGFHNVWTFGFLDDLGDPPDAGNQSASVVDDILLISDSTAAEPDGGGGAAFAFGFVDETFGTTFASGSVNVGSSPSPVNQLGLVVRGNPTIGSGYLLGIDFASGSLLLARSDSFPGDPSLLPVTLAHGSAGTFQAGQSYWLEFAAVGSEITGRVYSAAGGTLLDFLSAPDATYSEGIAGVVVRTYDVDGELVGAALRGTFDDVSAVPEPSSAALLGAGLALLGGVRNRAHARGKGGRSVG